MAVGEPIDHVEQRTYGDSILERGLTPAGYQHRVDIGAGYCSWLFSQLLHKTEDRLELIRNLGPVNICEEFYQDRYVDSALSGQRSVLMAAQPTLIQIGNKSGDQFAFSFGKGRRPSHDALPEFVNRSVPNPVVRNDSAHAGGFVQKAEEGHARLDCR